MDKIPEETVGIVVSGPRINTRRDGWSCDEGPMDKIPEETPGSVVRGPRIYILYARRDGWNCGDVPKDKIPEETVGVVVRGLWIKYQKRWLAVW